MTNASNLPIGYWLKQADNSISAAINRAQAANGVSRTEWQILNTLAEAEGTDREHLSTLMQPFVDATGLEHSLEQLTTRGWIATPAGGVRPLRLTELGRQQHAAVAAVQREVRQRAVKGISPEAYAAVIMTLQQIVSNLAEEATA